MTRSVLRALTVLMALWTIVPASAASADGPTVEITGSRSASVGDSVPIRISGFSGSFVTISTCGNEARRGSVDCNLVASKGLRLKVDGTSDDIVVVSKPPMKCPCVIRVASDSNDEVATVVLRIIGHPFGDVVEPAPVDDAVGLDVRATSEPDGFGGWVRSAAGGPARYAVVVTVTNRTTTVLRNVTLFGSVGRGETDELVPIDVPNPGPIAPGGAWTETVYTQVPTPSVGSFRFRVTATGAGATVDASVTERHSTPLLLGLLVFLVVDVLVLVMRRLARRRQRVAAPSTTTA